MKNPEILKTKPEEEQEETDEIVEREKNRRFLQKI